MEGKTADLVLEYDQGSGGLAVALTHIKFGADPETGNGTPERWLDRYGLVTAGNDDAVDLLDPDNDGSPKGEGYQNGTGPAGSGVTEVIFFLTSTRIFASRLDRGSSNRNTAGSRTMARLMATRCCCPPEHTSSFD